MNLGAAIDLCMLFEGVYLKPYLCPANVWTIGVGSTRYLDGRPVAKEDPPITRDEAVALLIESLKTMYLPGVLRACPSLMRYETRLNAVLDFTYNCGVGALQASTLRRRINEGRWEEAAGEFAKWNKGGGRVLPGLVKRRAAERALFMAGA